MLPGYLEGSLSGSNENATSVGSSFSFPKVLSGDMKAAMFNLNTQI